MTSATLATTLLPRLFAHSSVEAFGRQFGTYNFTRIARSTLVGLLPAGGDIENWKGWEHDGFKRDSTDQALMLMGPKKGSGPKRSEGEVPKVGRTKKSESPMASAGGAGMSSGPVTRQQQQQLHRPADVQVKRETVVHEPKREQVEDLEVGPPQAWDPFAPLDGQTEDSLVGYATRLAEQNWEHEHKAEQ